MIFVVDNVRARSKVCCRRGAYFGVQSLNVTPVSEMSLRARARTQRGKPRCMDA